ncbi:MAG: hypothetical protein Q8P73_02230 [bacterium]|nr:hypothetical protein [bacterium]
MLLPKFDLDKIKFATDEPTYLKAVELYESGKVTQFEEVIGAFSATVLGTKPYWVTVEARRFGLADCDCYLGQNDTLCKHMVAVSIYAVLRGKPISQEAKQVTNSPVCSGQLGALNPKELRATKQAITATLRYVKPYNGPSSTWFAYQDSLQEGCRRLGAIISTLPVSENEARLLVDLLLRLDNKLCAGGVDDSDGTVGGFMQEAVMVLMDYVKRDPSCVKAFEGLRSKETCFDWQAPLMKLLKGKH